MLAQMPVSTARAGRPTFVVIVSAEPRKNLNAVIRAFRKMPHADLIVIGYAGGASRMRKPPPNIRFAGYVEEHEKATLIADAHGLIMPSLAEGFGVPIIEALAANTPVLCSDIPVFREVAGELADYFDPFSTESICASVTRVLVRSGRMARQDPRTARRTGGTLRPSHPGPRSSRCIPCRRKLGIRSPGPPRARRCWTASPYTARKRSGTAPRDGRSRRRAHAHATLHWIGRTTDGAARRPGCWPLTILAVMIAASLPWSTSATSILVVLWVIVVAPTIDWERSCSIWRIRPAPCRLGSWRSPSLAPYGRTVPGRCACTGSSRSRSCC